MGELRPPSYRAPSDDDVVIQLRVRRANLDGMLEGITLGVDSLTHSAITQRLVDLGDGTYGLEVVTNPFVMAMAPDAVSPELVEYGDWNDDDEDPDDA
jgi:hypothetical protein